MTEVQAEFKADWSDMSHVDTTPANAFVSQLGTPAGGVPDGIFLAVGFVNPPLVLGRSPEEAEIEIARYNGRLQVENITRLVLSRERAQELIEVLQTSIDQYDEIVSSKTHA